MMPIRIDNKDPHNRIGYCSKQFKICNSCNATESTVWFLCEQNRCLYCFKCVNWWDRRTCLGTEDHQDVCLHKVIVE